jgi:DNA processing protein
MLPDEAWAAALASLPMMGPARLAAITAAWPPATAWQEVAAGRAHRHRDVVGVLGVPPAELSARWARAATAIDPAAAWRALCDADVGVAVRGSSGYPDELVDDVEPPAVLFHRGDPDCIAGPRVAIVGTRRCTRYGIDVAHDLGRELAEAGVSVVSGLALGIDGAAHAGALVASAAPPIAVVGCGLDVIYPRAHASLWRRVESAGVVLSEAPLGAPPERWRFPARNRIIAALADVVVVVESHEAGGSLHTVTEAERRDRTVLAVPGPVRSPASAGTNRLLADGAGPARDADDVLVALGLTPAVGRTAREVRPDPSPAEQAVLDCIGWQPSSLDQLAARTRRPLGELTLLLSRLEANGWVALRGSWYERVARRSP